MILLLISIGNKSYYVGVPYHLKYFYHVLYILYHILSLSTFMMAALYMRSSGNGDWVPHVSKETRPLYYGMHGQSVWSSTTMLAILIPSYGLINFIVWWIAWESQQLWREIQTGNAGSATRIGRLRDENMIKNHWSSEFKRLCLGTTFVLFLTRQQNGGGRINIIQDTKHLTGVF